MKQSTAIHLLLGLVVALNIVLLYLLLSPLRMSPLLWLLFTAFPLAIVLTAFAPSTLRRLQGLPPAKDLSGADLIFSFVVVAVVSPFAFFAVRTWGPFGSFAIMLVPIAFLCRFSRRKAEGTGLSRNTEVDRPNDLPS